MNTLQTQIYSLFIAGTDLYDNLSGQLYYGIAKEGISEPYGTFMFTTAIPMDTLRENIDEVGVQFSFFASTPVLANNLAEYCRALYQNTMLSSGAIMRRELTVAARRSGDEQDKSWQSDIEFLVRREV